MSASRINLTVEYDDGTEVEVTADQRDIVKFEAEATMSYIAGLRQATTTLMRSLAFHALRRTGRLDTKITREAWESTVPNVLFELQGRADPTKPGAPAATSSPSRSGRARATAKSTSTGNPKT